MTEKSRELSVETFAQAMKESFCHICNIDVVNTIRVCCVECNGLAICIRCFAYGLEKGTHKRSHDYAIIKPPTEVILPSGWSAQSEILLLEAIARFGFKWESVADLVSSTGQRTAEECKAHYEEAFLSPIGKPNLSVPPEGILISQRWKASGSIPASLRTDCEVEYDNDAELALADMLFLESEKPAEACLKLQSLGVYNKRILMREQRKAFVKNWAVLDKEVNSKVEELRTKEEKTLARLLRPLTRAFKNVNELERLIQLFMEEQRILERLDKIAGLRAAGQRKYNAGGNEESWIGTITSNPDYEELDEQEQCFCTAVGLSPSLFLRLKSALPKWHAALNPQSRNDTQATFAVKRVGELIDIYYKES